MLISLGGKSGSGKTNIAKILKNDVEKYHTRESYKKLVYGGIDPNRVLFNKVIYIGMDNFYKNTNGDPYYNYDQPDAFDWEQIINVLNKAKNKEELNIPIYDYTNSKQSGKYTVFNKNSYDIVIFEGILALYEKIIDLFDIRIYINADSDICLWRRIERDFHERDRSINRCGKQFFYITKKGAVKYIIPTQKSADFILDNNYIENLDELCLSNGYKTLLKYIKNYH